MKKKEEKKNKTQKKAGSQDRNDVTAYENGERGDNLILIGMPTSGKSTVGIILAKALGYDFLDGDILIQNQTGKKLSQLMEELGVDGFLALEEKINCELSCTHTVIAPGGSVIYGEKAMEHFRQMGKIIYLEITQDMLEERLHGAKDVKSRGVALRDGQSVEQLYREREPLYQKYADITVSESGHFIEDMVVQIVTKLHG